jgi:hypothetical protein
MHGREGCLFVACVLMLALVTACGFAAPPVGELIFYQDFDRAGRAACGHGWAVDQEVPAERLVPGRFGQACRFERARTNWLSPNQASVETDTKGFLPGPAATGLRVADGGWCGQHALESKCSTPGVAWQTQPVAVRVEAPHRPAKVFLFSAYLRSPQGGVRVRLSLTDANETDPSRTKLSAPPKGKDAAMPAKPPVETVAVPGEAVLGPEWRRVAARLEVDARREEQLLSATLEIVNGTPATLLADGLQLEQAAVYPLTSTDPTTWIPGGHTTAPAWIDLVASHTGFQGACGTLTCWVRPIPAQCGGTREIRAVATIGSSWWVPIWQLGGQPWYAGEAPTKQRKGKLSVASVEKRLFDKGRHDGWHHLALAWDRQRAVAYLDGKPMAETELQPGRPAPGTILRLGGSFLERTAMSGDLDEVCLFAGRLMDDQIAALAEAAGPQSARLPGVLLRRPTRIVFLRSESQATIKLEPVPYGTASADASIAASVPALNVELRQRVPPGKSAELVVRPWLSGPGGCLLQVEVKSGNTLLKAAETLEIFEQPPTPEFIIYAWGGTDTDLEARGFNCLFGEPRTLLERGLWAIARIDVRDGVPHPWSPETRARAEKIAGQVARQAMASPNVRACLVNSETGDPPFPSDEPWFRDWLKAETGLNRIPDDAHRAPVHVQTAKGQDRPALVPEDYPPYKFLRWWTQRGRGYYLLNNQLVRWMRAAGLHTAYYSDQPEAAGQFEAMDLVDFWGYPKSPEGLVARFSHASCMARLEGKPFQAMPGTIYWDDGGGLWIRPSDGRRKVLCLSPDCLREHLWISVACPTTHIGLYGLGERHTELYDPACDATMTDTYRLIQPVGVLVGGLPAEQARVALLDTDGLLFLQPGIDHYGRHWLTRTASRVLARQRVPFDWITDDHVYAGWLGRYSAVVVPGAWCLPERTHRALVKYAQAGGQVIADRVLRAEIPGVKRLEILSQAYPDEAVHRELGGWARGMRARLTSWAQVSPADAVFTYTREAGPARYLFVVNDRRQTGPVYEKWKVTVNATGRMLQEPLRDQGLEQHVEVTVPAGFALYDVLAHRRLQAATQGAVQRLRIHLAPGAAGVIAALPQPIHKFDVRLTDRMAAGSESAVAFSVLDPLGTPVAGRQAVELRVRQPDGQPWAGVQRYRRVENGSLTMPLRLPSTATRGTWRLEAVEWVSGQRVEQRFVVE